MTDYTIATLATKSGPRDVEVWPARLPLPIDVEVYVHHPLDDAGGAGAGWVVSEPITGVCIGQANAGPAARTMKAALQVASDRLERGGVSCVGELRSGCFKILAAWESPRD